MSNTNENLVDPELQNLLGDRYTATTVEPAQPQKARKPATVEPAQPQKARKPAPVVEEAPKPVIFDREESRKQWQPKFDPNDLTRVKNAAKGSLLYGGLCLLFFYWQQADLMASAAAVPSMLTCMLLTGVSVGKNLTK